MSRIFLDMPMAIYREVAALGSTDLKAILKSPAHFQARREESETSDALRVGSAVHCAILEPEEFTRIYAIEPPGLINKAKNPWKQEWDAFKAANTDKEILTRAEINMINGIHNSLRRHRQAAKILEISTPEVSVIDSPARLKGRADLLSSHFVSDIKTCEDADDMIRSIQNHQYYLQAALYIDLFERADGRKRQFLWVCCEKSPPYAVKVLLAGDDMIELGRKEYQAAAEIHRRCLESNDWPAYDDGIQEVNFRSYFKGVLA